MARGSNESISFSSRQGQRSIRQTVPSRAGADLLFKPRSQDPDLRLLEYLSDHRLIQHKLSQQIRSYRGSDDICERAFADTLLANAQLMPYDDVPWKQAYSRRQIETFLAHLRDTRPEIDTYKLNEDDMASIYRLDQASSRLSQTSISSDPMSYYLRGRAIRIIDDIGAGKSSKREIREVATFAEGVAAVLTDPARSDKLAEIRGRLDAHRKLAMVRGQSATSPTLCVAGSEWIIEALGIKENSTRNVKGCYSMAAQTAVVTTDAATILRRVRYYEPLLHEEIHAVQDNDLTDAEMSSFTGEESCMETAINEALTQGLTLRKLAREGIDTSESTVYIEPMIVIEALSGIRGEQEMESFLEELALVPRRKRMARMVEQVFGSATEENKEKFIEIGIELLGHMNGVDGLSGDGLYSDDGWKKRCLTMKASKEEHKSYLRQRLAEYLQAD